MEAPPGDTGMLVMFPMISEEPTTEHCPHVVPFQCPGIMWSHIGGMRVFVRSVGAEIEQLERSEKCRNNPECHEVYHWNVDDLGTDGKQEGHGHQLCGCHIGEEELAEPTDGVLVFNREVGVLHCAWIPMVAHVVGEHGAIAECREQPEGHLPERIVGFSVGCHGSMHGVVCGDEQSRVEIRLENDMEICAE